MYFKSLAKSICRRAWLSSVDINLSFKQTAQFCKAFWLCFLANQLFSGLSKLWFFILSVLTLYTFNRLMKADDGIIIVCKFSSLYSPVSNHLTICWLLSWLITGQKFITSSELCLWVLFSKLWNCRSCSNWSVFAMLKR